MFYFFLIILIIIIIRNFFSFSLKSDQRDKEFSTFKTSSEEIEDAYFEELD